MSDGRVERRLAAILAADVVGYSRLMGQDEAGTLARLRALRCDLIDLRIADHKGRIVKTTGDGILIEFSSVVEAVACAASVQREMLQRNLVIPQDQRIEFRIGINSGDVIVEGDDIHGDGVNIAARLEALAEPGGICISGIVHDQVYGRLEVIFDDTGDQNLKNIARPVRVYSLRTGLIEVSPTATPTLSLPDKPSLAVLPFQNMSGDPEQEYFADGVVEDIITALSRVGWFFVIARNSSFTYKGKSVDIKQVSRELGVRYVLEGSMRKAANRVRITGQLIEAETGRHIWADRFEGALEDVFDLQDRITESVVGAILPSVQRAEIVRAHAKPTENLDAYDLYLRAVDRTVRASRDGTAQAVSLLRRAIATDRNYALAKSYLSFVFVYRSTLRFDEPGEWEEAVALAADAIETARDDADTLRLAGHALSHFRQWERGKVALDRAVRLNPNSAQVLNSAGWGSLHRCEPDPAIDFFRRAIRLSPLDPEMATMLWGLAVADLMNGKNEEALSLLDQAIHESPNNIAVYRAQILALVRLGRAEAARDAVQKILTLSPADRISAQRGGPYRDAAFAQEMAEALRLAGLPE